MPTVLARIFHTPSSRDAARGRLARRPKRFRPGLYENILPGEESEANNASPARSKSQQKGYEISGLARLLLALAIWLLTFCPPGHAATPLPDYTAWRDACRPLPPNRTLGNQLPPKSLLPLKAYADFAAVLEPFLDLCRTGALARSEAWLGPPPNPQQFFNLNAAYYLRPAIPFQPFAQRLNVPAGARVFFHGDLHGDIHSLLAYLDALNRDGYLAGFRIANPQVRLAFLGDYTDRGRYGTEVLYTLMRLKLANPDQVLLVRGNHEDVSLVARYGFLAEVSGKYGREFDIRRMVRLYDFLPAVLYLASGTNVIQCNHGGLEPGFDPNPLLAAPPSKSFQFLGHLNQRRFLKSQKPWITTLPEPTRRNLESSLVDFLPESPIAPNVLGFMWNDFTSVTTEPQFAIDPGRAFVYGDQTTRHILSQSSGPTHRIRALFRGHQHSSELNPLMRRLIASRGVYRHWQPKDAERLLQAPTETLRATLETTELRPIPDASVWTFNVSPDSVYGDGCGFTFDTAGELITSESWNDWRLRVFNVEIQPTRTATPGSDGGGQP